MNLRRLSRQIYSLIPLTTREPLQKCKPAIVLQTLLRVNSYTQVAPGEPVRLICCAGRTGESPDTGRHYTNNKAIEGQELLTGPVTGKQ